MSRSRIPFRSLVACFLAVASGRASAADAPVPRTDPGRALYDRYCKLCHAADGSGYAADNAPSLVSPMFLATASDAFIARGIRMGRPGTAMAAYGTLRGGPLDDLQIAAIVRFLRSKGPRAERLPEAKVQGSPLRGAALYARECETCHGSVRRPGPAPQLHNTQFLAAASPMFLRRAIAAGRPPTKMPAFERRLSPTEIDDIVVWLRSASVAPPAAAGPPAAVPENLPLMLHPQGQPPQFTLREKRFVSAAQVKAALEEKRRFIIIDARSTSDWLQQHLPGALPIPYYDPQKLDRIPNDGTWVVAYCACPHHASGEIVDALRRRGFPNTAVLDEGILFWQRSGYALEGPAAAGRGAGR